jgi:CheY-like chemotaxis protein
MSKVYSGSAVPRHFVFVMADGTFVVQWDDTRVQDLLSGKYDYFESENFGHPINDYELNQLKSNGRVEHYNRNYVWLYALPEPGRFQAKLKTLEETPGRVRAYYLNTTLAKSQLENIRSLLETVGLSQDYAAYNRGDLIAITGKNGAPFVHYKEAEYVQKQLLSKAPQIFKDAAVAFVETTQTQTQSNYNQEIHRGGENSDLMSLIASQTDTTVTNGKQIVLMVSDEEERALLNKLCVEMKMDVRLPQGGREALHILEDGHSDLLVMDLQLPDMHGWEMLGKVKEIASLHHLPIIVMDGHSTPQQQSFALSVAKVDVYLVKPVSKMRLRQNIWMALKERSTP